MGRLYCAAVGALLGVVVTSSVAQASRVKDECDQGFNGEAGITGDPIPGADVSAEQSPGGKAVVQSTNKHGCTGFARKDSPGKYIITISGKSLVAAVNGMTQKKPSISIGIGGSIGGGRSGSTERPTDRSGSGGGVAVTGPDPRGDLKMPTNIVGKLFIDGQTIETSLPYCAEAMQKQDVVLTFTMPERGLTRGPDSDPGAYVLLVAQGMR